MMWNWLVSCLMAGATAIVYEGSPFYPGPERLWEMAETEKLSLFGTSAKYLDAVRKEGVIPANIADLSALRTLCSTGSPLSEEGFDFVYEGIKSDIHLSSISGGTDLMACFVLGCPVLPVYAGEIQVRGLGMDVAILDDDGKVVAGEQGELCCLTPFPSMPVGFWKDDDGSRYHAAYFDMYENIWRHGDWGTLTQRGGIIIHGRSDATLNPGGVRIGTAEIYRIVEAFDEIIEALVIGQSADNDVRIVLFVRLTQGSVLSDELQQRLRTAIRKDASPRHVPAVICAVTDIPRTRSGKITELAVRDIVHGRAVKNTEALSNPEALEQFKDRPELAT
jgi:acetoacetyl-CoA synthetase